MTKRLTLHLALCVGFMLLIGCAALETEPLSMLELYRTSLQQPDAEAYRTLTGPNNFDDRISEFFEVANRQPVAVEGFTVVEGLADTGDVVTADILRGLSTQAKTDIDRVMYDIRDHTMEYLANRTTAIVRITGTIPRFSRQNDLIDVVVTPLLPDDVKSLNGGIIRDGRMRSFKTVVTDEGSKLFYSVDQVRIEGAVSLQPPAVYSPQAGSRPNVGHIPGGGVLFYRFLPHLLAQDYPEITDVVSRTPGMTARMNRFKRLALVTERAIVRRFGSQAARIQNYRDGQVVPVTVPEVYNHFWEHYFDVLMAINPHDLVDGGVGDIEPSIRQLGSNDELTRQRAWFRLEAIGKPAFEALREALASSDPNVRFYAAMTLAAQGDTACLPVFRGFVSASEADLSPEQQADLMGKRILICRIMPALGAEGVPLLKTMLADRWGTVRFYALVNLEYMNHRLPKEQHISRPMPDRRQNVLFYMDHVAMREGADLLVVKLQHPRRVVLFGGDVSVKPGVEVKQGRFVFSTSDDGTAWIAVESGRPEKMGAPTILNVIVKLHMRGVPFNDICAIARQLVDDKHIPADVAWIDARN